MANEPMGQALVKARRAEIEALKGWARIYGRTLQDELALAIKLLLRQHALAHLQTQEGRADAIRQGHDPEADVVTIKASLARLTKEAFTLPETPDLLSVVRDDYAAEAAVEVAK